MPSQKEVHWSQLKIGIIVIVAIALLITLLFLMTSASGMSLFSKKVIAQVYFANSGGLKKGAVVELEGVPMGEVSDVQISMDPARKLTPVHATLKLNPAYHASLHTDTHASLGTVGVLGDTVVDLNSETATGTEFQSGGEFATQTVPTISDVVKSSQGTLQSLNVTLGRLDTIVQGLQQGQGTAGQLLKSRELYDNANATLAQLRALTTSINNGHGSVGKLLHDDTLYTHLNDTAARLDTIATGLQQGKGSAGKLLTDDALYNNLNQTMAHANSLLAEADAGRGGLGLLVKDPAFARRLNDTVTQLDTTLSNVNSGKGTLGKLATDQAAYDNLNKLLTESTSLVTAVRQDPKKYLSIKLKIF